MTEKRRGDAHRMLLRALGERAGGPEHAQILSAQSEAWASATFRGARHSLTLRMSGADAGDRAGRLAGELDAIEFRLPGHLVADIALTSRRESADDVTMEIEALTVEDA
jgi:hypothetical protein